MLILYNIALAVYRSLLWVFAFSSPKARQWQQGRRGWRKKIGAFASEVSPIWVHCASLGEFEQGRPVIESLKKQYPDAPVLLTFFSPSGYMVRNEYQYADWVYYLPLDTARNASHFIQHVNPQLAIFVKYEYWYYYLHELKSREIPSILISAHIRESSFNKLFGGFYKRVFSTYAHIFVQDEESKQVVENAYELSDVSACGDTRFDRVVQVADAMKSMDEIELFKADAFCLVAGSTWAEDEELTLEAFDLFASRAKKGELKLIIAPHQVLKEQITAILDQYEDKAILHSELFTKYTYARASSRMEANELDLQEKVSEASILIIDNYGTLNRIYYYADLVWIGGGFGSGIHNVLEAAVYGKKTLFGPNYQDFREAKALVELGAAMSIDSSRDLAEEIARGMSSPDYLRKANEAARQYVRENTGATDRIMKWIEERQIIKTKMPER